MNRYINLSLQDIEESDPQELSRKISSVIRCLAHHTRDVSADIMRVLVAKRGLLLVDPSRVTGMILTDLESSILDEIQEFKEQNETVCKQLDEAVKKWLEVETGGSGDGELTDNVSGDNERDTGEPSQARTHSEYLEQILMMTAETPFKAPEPSRKPDPVPLVELFSEHNDSGGLQWSEKLIASDSEGDEGTFTPTSEDEEDSLLDWGPYAKPKSAEDKQRRQDLYNHWDACIRSFITFVKQTFPEAGSEVICPEFQKRVTRMVRDSTDKLFEKFVICENDIRYGGSLADAKNVLSLIVDGSKVDIRLLISIAVTETSKRQNTVCFCYPEEGARELSEAVDLALKNLSETSAMMRTAQNNLYLFFDNSRRELIDNIRMFIKTNFRGHHNNPPASQYDDAYFSAEMQVVLQEQTAALELAMKSLLLANSPLQLGSLSADGFCSVKWEIFFINFKCYMDSKIQGRRHEQTPILNTPSGPQHDSDHSYHF